MRGDETLEGVLLQNEKLRKINRVLMDRVERSTDAQGNAFSLFQAAITLEKMVQQRTGELQKINVRLRDEIHERTGVEAALEASRSDAERAHTSKTKFFAAASHDLLQPLNIARLFLDALGEREADPEALHIVSRIDAALENAEALLGTLLDMSRLDSGSMRVERTHFAIDPLLRRLANDYALLADERTLRLRVVPSEAIVESDVRLLERVLRNFVSNALRYTTHGGVLVGTRVRGKKLRIEVWDTGAGMPHDGLREIFEEFKQLHVPGRNGTGLGLGLAIVDRIARLLDSDVYVRSVEGRGSVFGIDVPLGDPARVREADQLAKRRTDGNALLGKTVLVIDDDPGALDGMALVLDHWGCRTILAQSAQGAVAHASSRTPDFIVADYHLGKENGLDAIERVRGACDRRIAAVVITADLTPGVRARVERDGHWYLNKPVRVDRLRSLMSHVLA
ncbi:MAG: hypothetical protein NVSMB19_09240 [Vulcanimicrobiaceae bacterium]